MSAVQSVDPIDLGQYVVGQLILPDALPGSLQRAVDTLNHVYASTLSTLGHWPDGTATPLTGVNTGGTWVDWFTIPAHIAEGVAELRFLVRSARTTGNTLEIRVSSSVDAGMAATTTITPNTGATLVPTTQTAKATVTPGDNVLTVQFKGNGTGSAQVLAWALAIEPQTV